MKKLTLQEIWPLPVYEKIRDDYRRQVIAYKKSRRIEVGPFMTFVFEDRTTVKFQIQEILRAERVETPEGIAEELEGFNTMIPSDGHLSATLLISSPSEAEAEGRLAGLVGLRECVSLSIGSEVIVASFDANRESSKKVSAVQYLDFEIPPKARQLLASEACKLRVRHPNYMHEVELSREMRDALRQDLYAQT